MSIDANSGKKLLHFKKKTAWFADEETYVASIDGNLQLVQDRDLLLNFLQSYDMIEVSNSIATDGQ
jgi:hypothetical protein